VTNKRAGSGGNPWLSCGNNLYSALSPSPNQFKHPPPTLQNLFDIHGKHAPYIKKVINETNANE
jgi:hypothetical protein